jgi:putative hydrolase of HD superfamily
VGDGGAPLAGEHGATVAFAIEVGHLKRTSRAGWLIAGVSQPESVAEHSYRVGIIAYILALMEGADPHRAATLGLFHDVPECRLSDLTSVGKRFVQPPPAEHVIAEQTAKMPTALAAPIRELIGEFEGRRTPEALCAADADKLECLLQAREYQAQGNKLVQPLVDTMLAAVRTNSGHQLAETAARVSVDEWWREIVSSYGRIPDA